MPNGVKGWAEKHCGEDAGEAIHFYFVPVKVLLEEVGKPAGNWHAVRRSKLTPCYIFQRLSFLSLLCTKIRYFIHAILLEIPG